MADRNGGGLKGPALAALPEPGAAALLGGGVCFARPRSFLRSATRSSVELWHLVSEGPGTPRRSARSRRRSGSPSGARATGCRESAASPETAAGATRARSAQDSRRAAWRSPLPLDRRWLAAGSRERTRCRCRRSSRRRRRACARRGCSGSGRPRSGRPLSPLDLLHRHVRDADVLDRASVPVLLDHLEALLERSLRIRLMEVVEVDAVDAQPTKALVDLGEQHLGSAASLATLRRHNAALGNDERAAPIVCSLSPPV
jgi:hypothetical protein